MKSCIEIKFSSKILCLHHFVLISGIFHFLIKHYDSSGAANTSYVMQFDGKLMKSALTDTTGDADYLGFEVIFGLCQIYLSRSLGWELIKYFPAKQNMVMYQTLYAVVYFRC